MQRFSSEHWQRLSAPGGEALWLCPAHPAWFVPTAAGDGVLRRLAAGEAPTDRAGQEFLARLPAFPPAACPGRGALVSGAPPLAELWLHVTDHCDLACRHCLFACSPASRRELPLARLLEHVAAAAALGCRRFVLTGGEPLLHPGFRELVEALLAIPASRVAILTNALSANRALDPAWPRQRLHLQVSLDGRPAHHDALRGTGSYARLAGQLDGLRRDGWDFSLSCCVTRDNLADLDWLVDQAADFGAAGLHFMWHVQRGRGSAAQHVAPLELLEPLRRARRQAARRGVTIDNLKALAARLFTPPGTVHDGGAAGWESAAIGPDDRLYPSAATVGLAPLATPLDGGLAAAWQDSPLLAAIRQSSVTQLDDPWRGLLGGGDFDHSWYHAWAFLGADPYQPLHEQLAVELIAEAATRLPEPAGPALRLQMGELVTSCGSGGAVTVCRSNCLLDDGAAGREQVGAYYAAGAEDGHAEILNPVGYAAEHLAHIPAAHRFRGYGCGSPVLDAGVTPGLRVVDLGCGSGVECFIAARLAGPDGRVTGIDMLEAMLAVARRGAAEVRRSLGYDNLEFVNGCLEELPLADSGTDLVVSNCVLNLSADKRRTFAEIFRVLAPGGRLVAADVVSETPAPPHLLRDQQLRGECLGGALTQRDLLGILEESGFTALRALKRAPYRTVDGHPFFSLTFEAVKPAAAAAPVRVFYPGPAAALRAADGRWLRPLQTTALEPAAAAALGEQLWLLDDEGAVSNVAAAAGSCCVLPPSAPTESSACCAAPPAPDAPPPACDCAPAALHDSGCLVCGAPLVYQAAAVELACQLCGERHAASACCSAGHFVCDRCHSGDAAALIERLCLASTTTDPVELFMEVRRHPLFPLHGPQYHLLVPAVLLAVLRNAGLAVEPAQFAEALRRGAGIAGGSCASTGICGAAAGVGIAFSVLSGATPTDGAGRQSAQAAVHEALGALSAQPAARCCQRDCWLALGAAVNLARRRWRLDLAEVRPFACTQVARNRDCLGVTCPLWP